MPLVLIPPAPRALLTVADVFARAKRAGHHLDPANGDHVDVIGQALREASAAVATTAQAEGLGYQRLSERVRLSGGMLRVSHRPVWAHELTVTQGGRVIECEVESAIGGKLRPVDRDQLSAGRRPTSRRIRRAGRGRLARRRGTSSSAAVLVEYWSGYRLPSEPDVSAPDTIPAQVEALSADLARAAWLTLQSYLAVDGRIDGAAIDFAQGPDGVGSRYRRESGVPEQARQLIAQWRGRGR